MDEFSAILKARNLIAEAGVESVPVEIEMYLRLPIVNAILKVDYDLPNDQAGSSTVISGRNCIFVNGRHSTQRQRFTVLHEIGHIVLELPSIHPNGLTIKDLFSYQAKPWEEIACDVFAAELLLPEPQFRKDVYDEEIGFRSIEKLASKSKYDASLTCTGSRFAVLNDTACAFVLAESGVVRYVSYSLAMRNRKCWIPTRVHIPEGTLTANKLRRGTEQGPMEIEAYKWFENEKNPGHYIVEDVRLLEQWDQSLTLLWFDDTGEAENFEENEEDVGLQMLDGNLPWPSKHKRR